MSGKRGYIPDRGDILHMNFDPAAGHEYAGFHYALVLSPRRFQEVTGLAIVAGCTSQEKGEEHPMHALQMPLPPEVRMPKRTFVWSYQVKAIDFRERGAEYQTKAPAAFVDQVARRVGRFIGLTEIR